MKSSFSKRCKNWISEPGNEPWMCRVVQNPLSCNNLGGQGFGFDLPATSVEQRVGGGLGGVAQERKQ